MLAKRLTWQWPQKSLFARFLTSDNVHQQAFKQASGGIFPMNQSSKSTSTQKTTIAPLLSVRTGAKAIEFYKAAFGASELYRVDAPDGAVVAQLSVDGADFWLADESPEHLNFSPESLGGGTARMVMTVEDPDAALERAVAAGATIVWPVSNQYGWRLGRIVDPFGHHWEIGKPLPEHS
jgi:PhnB protein